jgi:hypothetical protein
MTGEVLTVAELSTVVHVWKRTDSGCRRAIIDG